MRRSGWAPTTLLLLAAFSGCGRVEEPRPRLSLPPLRDGIAFPAPSIAISGRPDALAIERELLHPARQDDTARLYALQLRLTRAGPGDLGAALAESEALSSRSLRAAVRSAIHLLEHRPADLFEDAREVLGRELAPCTRLLPIAPEPAAADALGLAALRQNVALARVQLGLFATPADAQPREPLDRRRRRMILTTLEGAGTAVPTGFEALASELAAQGDELLLRSA